MPWEFSSRASTIILSSENWRWATFEGEAPALECRVNHFSDTLTLKLQYTPKIIATGFLAKAVKLSVGIFTSVWGQKVLDRCPHNAKEYTWLKSGCSLFQGHFLFLNFCIPHRKSRLDHLNLHVFDPCRIYSTVSKHRPCKLIFIFGRRTGSIISRAGWVEAGFTIDWCHFWPEAPSSSLDAVETKLSPAAIILDMKVESVSQRSWFLLSSLRSLHTSGKNGTSAGVRSENCSKAVSGAELQ